MSAPDTGHPATPGRPGLPPWQPWAALALVAFVLHFVWENLQAPLYSGLAGAPHWNTVRHCARASVGDAGITLAAYASVAAWLRDRAWLTKPEPRSVGLYVAVGVAITIVIEALSVYEWRRWSYAPAMPLVLGIGIAPLVQWLVLPLLTLWLARRHLGAATPHNLSFPRTQS